MYLVLVFMQVLFTRGIYAARNSEMQLYLYSNELPQDNRNMFYTSAYVAFWTIILCSLLIVRQHLDKTCFNIYLRKWYFFQI